MTVLARVGSSLPELNFKTTIASSDWQNREKGGQGRKKEKKQGKLLY
jgi:hypothetical protein